MFCSVLGGRLRWVFRCERSVVVRAWEVVMKWERRGRCGTRRGGEGRGGEVRARMSFLEIWWGEEGGPC